MYSYHSSAFLVRKVLLFVLKIESATGPQFVVESPGGVTASLSYPSVSLLVNADFTFQNAARADRRWRRRGRDARAAAGREAAAAASPSAAAATAGSPALGSSGRPVAAEAPAPRAGSAAARRPREPVTEVASHHYETDNHDIIGFIFPFESGWVLGTKNQNTLPVHSFCFRALCFLHPMGLRFTLGLRNSFLKPCPLPCLLAGLKKCPTNVFLLYSLLHGNGVVSNRRCVLH